MGSILAFDHLLEEYDPFHPDSFRSRSSIIVWMLHRERHMLRQRVNEVDIFVWPGGTRRRRARWVRDWLARDRRVLAQFDRLRGWG